MPRSKYHNLIKSLQDNELYSSYSIADLAVDFYKLRPDGKARTMIRKALYCRAKHHRFPTSGDGVFTAVGHPDVVAWYGRRWKKTVEGPERGRVTAKPHRHSKMRIWGAVLLAIPFFALVGFVSAVGPSKLVEGYELLKSQGPAAAYRFFTANENDETLIGKGWSALRNQKTDEARQIANKILVADNRFKGNALYLLAYTEFYESNLTRAEFFFQECLSYYQNQGNHKAIYLTYIGLARTMIEEYCLGNGSLSLAEKYLVEALYFGEPTPEYYGLNARIRFELDDYFGAREWAEIELKSHFDEVHIRAQVYCDLSFYSTLSGDLANGFNYAKLVNSIALKIPDLGLYYYNLINEMILAKCLGLDYAILQKEIEEYVLPKKDPTLLRYLTFAMDYQCE